MAGDSKLFQEALKRGSAHAWNEQWDKAADEYRRALREFPDDVSARTYLAMALYKSGAFPESLELYKGLMNAQPSNLTMLQRVAELQQKVGDNLSAAVSYGRLADAHTRRGAPKEAFKSWQKLVEITPGDPILWNSLISAALQAGTIKEVIPGYLGLARDFALQSRFQEAIQVAQRAQTLDPTSPLVAPMLAAIRKGIEYSFRAASFGEEVFPEDLMRYIPSVDVLGARIQEGGAEIQVPDAPVTPFLPASPVDVSGMGQRVLEVLFRPTVEAMGRGTTIEAVRNQLARLGSVVDVQTRVEGRGSVVFVIMLATSLEKEFVRRAIEQSSSERAEKALQVDPQELLRRIEILELEAKAENESTAKPETPPAGADAADGSSPADVGLPASTEVPADLVATIEPETSVADLIEAEGEALPEEPPLETEPEVAASTENEALTEEAPQEQVLTTVEEQPDERILAEEVFPEDAGEAVEHVVEDVLAPGELPAVLPTDPDTGVAGDTVSSETLQPQAEAEEEAADLLAEDAVAEDAPSGALLEAEDAPPEVVAPEEPASPEIEPEAVESLTWIPDEAFEEVTEESAFEETSVAEITEAESETGAEIDVEIVEPEPDTAVLGESGVETLFVDETVEAETAAADEPVEGAAEVVAPEEEFLEAETEAEEPAAGEEVTDVPVPEPAEDAAEAHDEPAIEAHDRLEISARDDEADSDERVVEAPGTELAAAEEPQPDEESTERIAGTPAVDADAVEPEVERPSLEEEAPVPQPEEMLARLMRQAEEARRSGRLDETIAAYEEAVAANVAGSRQLLELGELYEAAGNEEAASQAFARAVEISPDLVRARLGLARIDLQLHRLDSAESLARECVEGSFRDDLGPEKTSSIGLLLEILRERAAYGDLGRTAEGLGWLKSVAGSARLPASLAERVATVPRELLGPSVGEHLDEIAALPRFVRGEVTTSLWKAEQMLGEAKLRTASDEMYRVVSAYPDFLPAQSLLGRVMVAQGRLADAGERSRRLVDLYHLRGRDDSAMEVLEWMTDSGLAKEADMQRLNLLLRAHGRDRQAALVEEETAAARRAEQERRAAEEAARAIARMEALRAAEEDRREVEEAARRFEEEAARKAAEEAERRIAAEEAVRRTLEELAKKAEEEEAANAAEEAAREEAVQVEAPAQTQPEPVPPSDAAAEASLPVLPIRPEKQVEAEHPRAGEEPNKKRGGIRGMFRALRGVVKRESEDKMSEHSAPGTDTPAGVTGHDALLRLAESRYAFGDAKGAATLLRSALQDERIASDLATKVAMLRVLQLMAPSDDELQGTLRGILDTLGLPGELVD